MRALPVRSHLLVALAAAFAVGCGGPVDADGNPIDDPSAYAEEGDGLAAIELPSNGTGPTVVNAGALPGQPAAAQPTLQAFAAPGGDVSDSSPDPIPAHLRSVPTVVYLNGVPVVLGALPSDDSTGTSGRRGGTGGDVK